VLALLLPLLVISGAPAKSKAHPAPSAATPAAAAPSKLEPKAEIARINALFEALDFEAVVPATVELLARPELPLDVKLEGYRLQGSARAIVEDPVDAEQPFRLLLRARPEYELPGNTPPKILAVFRKVQSEEKALASTMRQVERTRLIANLKLIGDPPTEAQGGQALTFSWRLRDPQGVVDAVELPYRRAGQRSFSTLALERNDSGLWTGQVPAEFTADEKGFTLEYFLRTTDKDGPLLTLGSEMTPRTVAIKAGLVTVKTVKPLPVAAFVTSTVVTIILGLAAGGFALAVPFQEKAYQQGALTGRSGADLVVMASQGRTFAVVANAGWIAAGVGAATSLIMIPLTRFGE
jgi:hypothetical protein